MTGRRTVLFVAWVVAICVFTVMAPGSASGQSDGIELVGHLDFNPDISVAYNDVWGYSAPDGTELAILGSTIGTHFINVTDPTDPHEVAFIEGAASIWRDMKTYGHYAYSVNESGGGLQVIDLVDPLHPVLVDNRLANFTTAHNIFVDEGAGTLWVVGARRGAADNVIIYSLEPNPAVPEYIATWGGAYLHDVYVRDGIAYGAAMNVQQLWTLDVSNLPLIEVLGTVQTPGHFTHNTWLTEDGRYCLTTDEVPGGHVGIVDVEDPTAPVLVAEWSNPDGPRSIVHNAFVLGDYAYVSWYTTGLQVIDLRNPLQPTRAGYFDTYPGTSSSFDGAWGVYPFARSGLTYISDISTGLYIVRFDGARAKVSGRVLDSGTDAPLSGVRVSIPGSPETATTDAAGAYSLRLLPGSYDLHFNLFGYAQATQSVVVAGQPIERADVRLVASAVGVVEGLVETADGDPVEGARVRVLDGTEGGERSGEDRGVGAAIGGESPSLLEVRTDAGGRFEFEAVPEGEHVFAVDGVGFPAAQRTLPVEPGTNDYRFVVFLASVWEDFESEQTTWTVGGPEDTAVSGTWELGTPILTGDVAQPGADHSTEGTRAFLTGLGQPGDSDSDHDVDGGATRLTSPAYDLTSLSRPALSFYYWYQNVTEISLPDDEFVVEGSTDGGATWRRVFATDEGESAWRQADIALEPEYSAATAARFRFVASDLGNPSRVEAALDDLELYTSAGRIVASVVAEDGGRPLSSGSVTDLASGVTVDLAEDGSFELVTAPGPVELRVHSFGFETTTLEAVVPNRATLEADFTLVALPTQTVRGTVRASAGGTLLSGVLVECVDTPVWTVTDESGEWELELPFGEYRFRFSSDDFAASERDVDVNGTGGPVEFDVGLASAFLTSVEAVAPNPSAGDSVLRFRLARAARVQLEVFDPSGRRVRVVSDQEFGVGDHEVRWDGRTDRGDPVATGLYFQRFRGDGLEDIQRVIRIR